MEISVGTYLAEGRMQYAPTTGRMKTTLTIKNSFFVFLLVLQPDPLEQM